MNLDFLADREHAERIPCPHCRAPAGVTCRRAFDGKPVVNFAAHQIRIKRASNRETR